MSAQCQEQEKMEVENILNVQTKNVITDQQEQYKRRKPECL